MFFVCTLPPPAPCCSLPPAGGGGGSPSDDRSETPDSGAVAEQPGTATPDDSGSPGNGPSETSNPFETAASRQLNSELTGLLRTADTVIFTDVVSLERSTELNRISRLDFGNSFTLNPSPYGSRDSWENIATMPAVQEGGVWLFHSRWADCNDAACSAPVTIAESYGGWLDHNFFYVTFFVDGGPVRVDDESQIGWSLGNDTGSVPVDGSANWTGAMVATDLRREEIVRGDAELMVDFGAASVDVAFTDIRELETGAERAAIRFDAVPMSSRGFEAGADGHRITGAFYGPAHVEAGGVFEHEHTFGAFGATRR